MPLGLGTNLHKTGMVTPGVVTSNLVMKHMYPAGAVQPLSDGALHLDGTSDSYAYNNTTETITGDITVKYKAYELRPMLQTVKKGLALYGRYAKVLQATGGINFVVADDDKVFIPSDHPPQMKDILSELEDFLNTKDYKIPYGAFAFGRGKYEKVGALEFTFTSEYVLKKMSSRGF